MSIDRAVLRAWSTSVWGITAIAVVRRFPGIGILNSFKKFIPSFVKTYTNLAPLIKENISRYVEEVREGAFPDDKHSFSTKSYLKELLQSDVTKKNR
ncbi:MAG: 3-methyl-2-oxobutanoate hydroxymethyltransferase [Deltaproteobacteria bacterium]|nr:3-methyl-2-oxobutanoate hydroxymethyltransferase [Deltaproteobacteria bacterium]